MSGKNANDFDLNYLGLEPVNTSLDGCKRMIEQTGWDNLNDDEKQSVASAAMDSVKQRYGDAATYLASLKNTSNRLLSESGTHFTNRVLETAPVENRAELAELLYAEIREGVVGVELSKYDLIRFENHVCDYVNAQRAMAGLPREDTDIMKQRMYDGATQELPVLTDDATGEAILRWTNQHASLQDTLEKNDWDTRDVVDAAVHDVNERFGSVHQYLTQMNQYRIGHYRNALQEHNAAKEFTKETLGDLPAENREEIIAAMYRRLREELPAGQEGQYAATAWKTLASAAVNDANDHEPEPLHCVSQRLETRMLFHDELERQQGPAAAELRSMMNGEPVNGIAAWLQDDAGMAEVSGIFDQIVQDDDYDRETPNPSERHAMQSLVRDTLEKSLGEVHQEIRRMRDESVSDSAIAPPASYASAMRTLLSREAADVNVELLTAVRDVVGMRENPNSDRQPESLRQLAGNAMRSYAAMRDIVNGELDDNQLDFLMKSEDSADYMRELNDFIDRIPTENLGISEFVLMAEAMENMPQAEWKITTHAIAERQLEKMMRERIGDVNDLPQREQERLRVETHRSVENGIRNGAALLQRERELSAA